MASVFGEPHIQWHNSGLVLSLLMTHSVLMNHSFLVLPDLELTETGWKMGQGEK